MKSRDHRARNVSEVAETLRNAKSRGKPAVPLIGAGCSVSAGIPLASDLIAQIKVDHPLAYERATEKSYQGCMSQLNPEERRNLISSYVKNAKINWEHVCIAVLLQHGFIGRILTTNFDPLIARACALIGQLPAFYDAAVSKTFRPDSLSPQSVIYLNGQIDGFIQLNATTEFDENTTYLDDIIRNSNQGAPWIVVGYSGENDPTFKSMSAMPDFRGELFWLARQNSSALTSEPPEAQVSLADHILDFLEQQRSSHLVVAPSAEDFLVRLCKELGIFPPPFLAQPFSFLAAQLEQITPFSLPGISAKTDFLTNTKALISQAIRDLEESAEPVVGTMSIGAGAAILSLAEIQKLLMAGKHDDVIRALSSVDVDSNPQARELLFFAYLDKGATFAAAAIESERTSSAEDWLKAEEAFRSALTIEPERNVALGDLANVLFQRALHASPGESSALYAEGDALYKRALDATPHDVDIASNWANGLASRATRPGEPYRDTLFQRAATLFERVIDTAPNNARAHAGLAEVHRFMSRDGDLEYNLKMLGDADFEYRRAVALGGATPEILNNWGNAIQGKAYLSPEGERARYLLEAAGHYREALKKYKDHASSWINLGKVAFDLVRAGLAADSKWISEAEDAYQSALALPSIASYPHAKIRFDLVLLYAYVADMRRGETDVWLEKASAVWDNVGHSNGVEKVDRLLALGYLEAVKAKATVDDLKKDELFASADGHLSEALEIEPDNFQLLGVRADVRLNRARRQQTSIQAFDAAINDHRLYAAKKPNELMARVNLCVALSAKAERLVGDLEKQRAIRLEIDGLLRPFLEPGKRSGAFLAVMGGNLLYLARFDPLNSDRYVREAESLCLEAERLSPGSACYNIACAKSVLGDYAGAEEFLKVATRVPGLTQSQLKSDVDLATVQEQRWFLELLATLPEK